MIGLTINYPTGDRTRVDVPDDSKLEDVLKRVGAEFGRELSPDERARRERAFAEIMTARAKGESNEGEGVGSSPSPGRRVELPGRSGPGRRAPDEVETALPDHQGPPPLEAVPARAGRDDLFADLPSATADGEDSRRDVLVGVGGAPRPGSPAVGARDTSRAAYAKLRWSGKLTEQQEVIYAWLRSRIGDATRSEIADGTGVKLSSVCGRVNEMIEVGALRETRKRRCRSTGETAWGIAALAP